MSRRYLALDLGAESGRAMVAHLAGRKLELTEVHRFPNTPVRLPGGLYWDTLRLFHEICEGIRSARAAGHLDSIGVDTWGVDFGLLGSSGNLLGNPRHYRDAADSGASRKVFSIVPQKEIFRQTGIQSLEINSLYQLYALKQHSPQLLNICETLLFMPDLFNFFLTGTAVSERTIASTSQFYNPVTRRFATDMLRALGINASFLPELVDPGTELGAVLPAVAAHCDLDSETPVFTVGSHDTASAVAAVPAAGLDNWCFISSGTWSLMGVELDCPLMDDASFESNYTNEMGIENRTRFLKNIPGLWVLQECKRVWAREGNHFTYAELLERAHAAPPSASVLDLDLFLTPGDYPARMRDYCARTQQEFANDPGFITRLVLFSLATRYRDVLHSLESLTGRSIEIIHIVGGGSRNRLLNQLTADVTGRIVVAGPAEATAAGNGLTQALGTGQIRSLEELRAIIRHSFEVEEFRPAPSVLFASRS